MSGHSFDPKDTTSALARVRAWEDLGQAAINWVDLRDQSETGQVSPASLRDAEQKLAQATQELRRHVPAPKKPIVQETGPLCILCLARPSQGTLRWASGSVPCCAPCREERTRSPVGEAGLKVAQARQAKGLVTRVASLLGPGDPVSVRPPALAEAKLNGHSNGKLK